MATGLNKRRTQGRTAHRELGEVFCRRVPRDRLSVRLLLLAGASFLLPSSLIAQVIQGTVRDLRSGEPIPQVQLIMETVDGIGLAAVVSDSVGAFSLVARGAGRYYLSARRLGFEGKRDGPVDLEPGDTLQVVFHLRPAAQLLDTAMVAAGVELPHLARAGFYRRKSQGFGAFLERVDLEVWIQPARTWVDVLRAVPGVLVHEPGTVGRGRSSLMSTGMVSAQRKCSLPRVYLDGLLVTSGIGSLDEQLYAVNHAIRPHDLEAIEVYRRPSEIPAEYGGAESGCGVILVWSRRGR